MLDAAGDETAAAAFEAALAANPAHAVALVGRAALPGGTDASAADLQAAIAAYPRFVDAYVRLAGLQSDSQRALQTLRRAESYTPSPSSCAAPSCSAS